MKPVLPLYATALATLLAASSAHSAAVHLADIVALPTVTIDFEGGPDLLAAPLWLQQGVLVSQVNSDNGANDIWLGGGMGFGQHSWYPDAGDDGWTRITRLDAANFDAVSFFGGSGYLNPPQTLYVELADNGVVVLSATLDATFAGSWFGFSGGDFDEVRLRATRGNVTALDSCPPQDPGIRCNYAWLDNIQFGPAALTGELPAPGSIALSLLGLAALRAATVRRGRLHATR